MKHARLGATGIVGSTRRGSGPRLQRGYSPVASTGAVGGGPRRREGLMEGLQLADEPRRRLYRDRADAGVYLAARLKRYAGQDVLVLGVPRGGVPVAAEVARRLDAELDVVVARKLGAPISPELAIGAVTANGGRFLNDDLIRDLGVPTSYLERVTAEQRADARQREARFRGDHPAPRVRDRVVLVGHDAGGGALGAPAAAGLARGRGAGRLPGGVRGPAQRGERAGVPARPGDVLGG